MRDSSTSVMSLPSGKAGSSPAGRAGPSASLSRSRRFAAMARQRERALDLARPLSRGRQLVLKISVGDADHRRDRVSIRFPSDIGDAVFRDNDVAERTGNRRVRVGPDYVGLEPVSQMAPAA